MRQVGVPADRLNQKKLFAPVIGYTTRPSPFTVVSYLITRFALGFGFALVGFGTLGVGIASIVRLVKLTRIVPDRFILRLPDGKG